MNITLTENWGPYKAGQTLSVFAPREQPDEDAVALDRAEYLKQNKMAVDGDSLPKEEKSKTKKKSASAKREAAFLSLEEE